ncbi:MAG: response regulator [Candidatus Omnitrophota bacterium]|nr:response regulator [Candidatus Omnitrophota bacterium]
MPKKILVVDDETNIVLVISSRLKANGFQVVTAECGRDALEKADSEKPDLIVLDVMMPSPDGYEVCRMLKGDPKHKNVPVIILTAKVSEQDRSKSAECGADAFVTKPYSPSELLGKIKDLIP